jgi:hypothetical protein
VTVPLRRIVKVVVIVVAAAAALLGLAVMTSAAVDRPAKTISSAVTVEASRETVWGLLTDFEGYQRWNPLITEAAGDARIGAEIEVAIHPPDSETQHLTPEITILRPNRKLAWMSRDVLPGISDREYEVIIDRLGDDRVRVVMHKRFEGLLIPFTSTAEEQQGLDLMAAALKEQAEQAARGEG